MQADLPHTLYLPRDKKGKAKDDYRPKADDKALALQEAANREAEERRRAKAEKKEQYTTEELFKK